MVIVVLDTQICIYDTHLLRKAVGQQLLRFLQTNLEFVLEVLRNFDGPTSFQAICKEIVKTVTGRRLLSGSEGRSASLWAVALADAARRFREEAGQT
jgi:hypothetical protein